MGKKEPHFRPSVGMVDAVAGLVHRGAVGQVAHIIHKQGAGQGGASEAGRLWQRLRDNKVKVENWNPNPGFQ